jgi:hypothetical protein
MIRSRIVSVYLEGATTAAQTDAILGSVTLPKTGKLRSVSVNATACAGTATRTFTVYKGGAANLAGASCTTAMCAAVTLADTPLPVTGQANIDGSQNFLAGETIYVKYTTGSATTSTRTKVDLEVTY